MSSQHECGAEEHVRINSSDSKIVASRSRSPGFIICAILLSVAIVGFMSFCFIWHHSIKDPCSAEAILGINKDEWMWNTSNCPWQIVPLNKTAVKIISGGIYFTDIQVQAANMTDITDLTLKIYPGHKEYVTGSFQSPNEKSCYVRMSQILVLKKGDTLNLKVHGDKARFSTYAKTTYWKILKHTGL